ncbi:MAG: hypothetical protein LBQ50_04665 [Planctomycetaceae bacterium]|jgi:hypothetical protein|nr:hypothetical protein [Planctomycetaceae bacterium]
MLIRSTLLFVFLFVPFFVTGCSQNVRVEGTVSFSDGTTIDRGQVIFENDTKTYIGNIRKNGTFSIGVYKDGEGIPKGHYRAAVTGVFEETPPTSGTKLQLVFPTHLVAGKYRDSKTSGFEFDIQGKTTGISLVVERTKKEEQKQQQKQNLPLLPATVQR